MEIVPDALRALGYVKIEHGFSCGRHYIIIDGKVIAQTPGDDVWMRDEDVCDLARAIAPGCTWEKGCRLDEPGRFVGVVLQKDREMMRQALRDNGYENMWHKDMWSHPNDKTDGFTRERETFQAYSELKEKK